MKTLIKTLSLFLIATPAWSEEIYRCEYQNGGYDIVITDPTVMCGQIQELRNQLDSQYSDSFNLKSEAARIQGEYKKQEATLLDCQFVRDEYIKGFFLAVEYLHQSKRIIRNLKRKLLVRGRYER